MVSQWLVNGKSMVSQWQWQVNGKSMVRKSVVSQWQVNGMSIGLTIDLQLTYRWLTIDVRTIDAPLTYNWQNVYMENSC